VLCEPLIEFRNRSDLSWEWTHLLTVTGPCPYVNLTYTVTVHKKGLAFGHD
jgi:hypothetical protein